MGKVPLPTIIPKEQHEAHDWKLPLVQRIGAVMNRSYVSDNLNNFVEDLTTSTIGLVFTDRVRSTSEGYVLTCVCPSVCLSNGGEGYHSQIQLGEGIPARSRWGVPPIGIPPGQVQMGGVPQHTPLAGDTPPPPCTGQQMEYLICSGLYASCVHAGGLSCYCHGSSRHFFITSNLPRVTQGRR